MSDKTMTIMRLTLHRLLLAASGCFAVALAACSSGDGSGPTPDEHLGTPFTAADGIESSGGQLAWLPSGDELVYTAGVGNLIPLEGFRPADGARRTIDARLRSRGPLALALSGRLVCSSSSGLMPSEAGAYECVDQTDGTVLSLTDRVAYGPYIYGALAVGADTAVAYGVMGPECVAGLGGSTCDSLYLYNLPSSTRTFLTIGLPDAFSPDGRQLLYRKRPCNELGGGNTCQTSIFDLTTQVSTDIWPGASDDIEWLPGWTTGGPRRLVTAKGLVDTLVLRNLSPGTTRVIRNLGAAPAGYVFPSPAISADGAIVAYWVVAPGQGISYLEVSDLGTGQTSTVAIAFGTATGGMALSADGKRIAYVFANRGYWSDIQ
jgi:Tol biopolymer transport system component